MGTAIAGTVSSNSGVDNPETAAAVVDPEEVFAEEAAKSAASSNKTKPVRFVCNFVPDLKVTLPSGNVVAFRKGVAYTESRKDTAALRKIAARHNIVEG